MECPRSVTLMSPPDIGRRWHYAPGGEGNFVALKRFFGSGDPKEDELQIDDLIVLERYDEAEARLKEKLELNRKDLHAHIKLAEVFMRRRELAKAIDEYVFVADEYAADGFYDKGIALLSKVSKLVPGDDTLLLKIENLNEHKRLEHNRALAIEGLTSAQSETDTKTGNVALEIQRLWDKLSKSPVVRRLDGEQLRRTFGAMKLSRYAAGEMLASYGEKRPVLFLLGQGDVEASVPGTNGRAIIVRTFGAGDIVGERALLEQDPWPANYTSKGSVIALILDRPGFESALVGNPDPRGLVEALRGQQLDREVAAAVERLQRKM